jgi:hypothetical protein
MNISRTGFAPLVLIAALGAPSLSHAGFFIPKDTTMVMGTFSPDEQNYELAYGFDRRVSGSVGLTRVKEAGESQAWRNVAMTQLSYLLHRQPTTDGIFNAYVWAGPIAQRLESSSVLSASKSSHKHAGHGEEPSVELDRKTRAGAQAGLWLDFETRSVYTRLKLHSFRTEGWRRNEVVAQAMLAPYKADYEDIASWGGVQVKRVSGDKTEITPYVRFFQRNWWIDAGISVDRAHRDNFFLNLSYTY